MRAIEDFEGADSPQALSHNLEIDMTHHYAEDKSPSKKLVQEVSSMQDKKPQYSFQNTQLSRQIHNRKVQSSDFSAAVNAI